MVHFGEVRKCRWLLSGLFCACMLASAQQREQAPLQLDDSGQVIVAGRAVPYRIRRLPVSSFPNLPPLMAAELTRRGCMIPQTWQAHGPENVIRGSFERSGSSDWAALCSAEGTVTLLVFFSGAPQQPVVLAAASEMSRLQAHGPGGVLGFSWGIDPAGPSRIREAQAGMEHRPPPEDHDALADSLLDRGVVYRFFRHNRWTVLAMPEN